jgi:hypothetical protein
MHGTLPRDEALVIVRHLLTGCLECVAVTRPFWELGDVLSERRRRASSEARGHRVSLRVQLRRRRIR